jgi:hypothetical protein
MSHAIRAASRVTAPRTTLTLAGFLALGVLVEAAIAGGFLGGQHMWMSWHENLGGFLVLPPLASLIVGSRCAAANPRTPPCSQVELRS